jgi:excisionase family DNA binding protein
MFKLIQRGQVYADSHGWPVLIRSSDDKTVRYWRQGRINTASIDRFNNDFEPLTREEAHQIRAELVQASIALTRPAGGITGRDMASDKPITAQQAADLLIVSARVIYRLIDSGELAGRKVGNKYRTTEAACIAYLKTPRDPVIANAGEHKGEVLCQSPSGAACGTVISLRRQEKELGDLLARGTKSRLRSSTTS